MEEELIRQKTDIKVELLLNSTPWKDHQLGTSL